jgi:hypothetical protein
MRAEAAALLAALALINTASVSSASGETSCETQAFSCSVEEDATYVQGMSREALLALEEYPDGKGGSSKADPNRPVYEYATIADCPDALPGTETEDILCTRALRSCPPETVGPLSAIWRRVMQKGREIEPWDKVGVTCHTDIAPGARPALTMADIKAEFLRTPWAKPQVSTQPTGNTTLVNLETFYSVDWSEAGFAPGEVDTGSIRGFTVRIRPKLLGFTYVFGDGTTFGPTTSTGGPYPDGDVTHIYAKPGSFSVRVDTTFAADFSIDGRTWDPIPSTVTVPGPTTTLTVREAKAVLVRD